MLNGSTVSRAFLVCGAIIAIWLFSAYVRANTAVYLMGADALEATYHVILTMQALQATPVSAHGWLPTVTLDPLPEDFIRWGSAQTTPGGALIYTSFPPLGFLVPYWVLSIIGAPLTLHSLFWFNSVTGLLTALLIGWFCTMVAARNVMGAQRPEAVVWPWFAGGAVLYLSLSETLVSHGATYWPHSLSQPVFVAACCLVLRQVTGTPRKWEAALLAGLCALYCALEWTGFVFSAGVVLLLLARKRSEGWGLRSVWGLPGLIMLAAGLVLLLTVAHFALFIGVNQFFDTSAARAAARAGHGENNIILMLGRGYIWSFGLLVPLGLLAAAIVVSRRQGSWVWAMAFVTAFPLVENLLLMNHALYFPFDRMKAVVPLVLAGVLALRHIPVRFQTLVGALCLAFIVTSNLYLFDRRTENRGQWAEWDAENRALIARAQSHVNFDCAVAVSEQKVRGYLNILFERDIYEEVGAREIGEAVDFRQGCAVMVIESDYVMVDLPRVVAVDILTPEGVLLERFE